MKTQATRRRFLTGAGGLALALPWLEKFDRTAHAQQGPVLKRVIAVTYPMGIPGGVWSPQQTGSTFTLPYVTAPLERFKSRMLMISAIDNLMLQRAGGGAYGNGHPGKAEASLTGTLPTNMFNTVNTNQLSDIITGGKAAESIPSNGPSIEHVIGQSLPGNRPFRSVDLAIDGGAHDTAPSATIKSAFFHEAPGTRVTMQMQPHLAFDQLFANVSGGPSTDLEVRKLRLRNKSVLDAVRSNFKQLKQGLGVSDQQRLQDHADRIRTIELDPVVRATCAPPPGIPAAGAVYKGMKMDQLSALQTKILANAMGCDLAPIGRLEFQHQQSPRFGIPSVDVLMDALVGTNMDWHGMVHGEPLPGTTDFLRPGRSAAIKTYDQRLQDGYRFYVQQFANLLEQLDAIPEGQGTTVLDNSLVILASDLGEGFGHDPQMMGYILAGNLGNARKGFHYNASKDFNPANVQWVSSQTNVNQLLNSIIDMAGVKDSQGQPANFGLGGWLQAMNLPRRIDALFA